MPIKTTEFVGSTKKKYPYHKYTLRVKMRCDYHPNGYKRCSNKAEIIEVTDPEGKEVHAYCQKCFNDYKRRNSK